MSHRTAAEEPSAVGRYLLHQPIARGGMATVHAARLVAAEGVTRLVAAKRLHPHYIDDPEFVAMFHDEARIASRIHHPNVVPVLDVILDGEEVILVQEYVHGVPLSYLLKLALADRTPIALSIALSIVSGILSGLHAAHEATDDVGEPLGIVHRDVSPQNVLVSVDGIPRLVDFGIAKAKTSIHHTREGFFKGKLAYMAPEQLRGEQVTRAADVYAAGVLLWELVVNRRFYDGKNDPDFVRTVAHGATMTPTQALEAERHTISAEHWSQVYLLEPIIMRAMSSAPEARYASAAQMAAALADIAPNAPITEVAAWVRSAGAEYIDKRQKILLANEESYRASRLSESARAVEDGVRRSGARMRIEALTIDAHRDPSMAPGPLSLTPTADGSRFVSSAFVARAILPWVVSAALLLVVGALVGMVIRREPEVALPSRVPTTTRVADTRSTVIEIEPEEARPTTTSAEPSAAAQPAQPAPASRPLAPSVVRFVAPPVRVVPAAPVRAPPPPPTPVVAPPAASKDCNPPFYFDGNKKVFKPSCI
jgi:serine/threonine-protein kinase